MWLGEISYFNHLSLLFAVRLAKIDTLNLHLHCILGLPQIPTGKARLLLSGGHHRFINHLLIDAHEALGSLPSCSKSALHSLINVRLISWRVAPGLLRVTHAYAVAVRFVTKGWASDFGEVEVG